MRLTNNKNNLQSIIFILLLFGNFSKVIAQDFRWAKRIGGSFDDQVLSMKVGNSGNVYMYGNFRNSVDFGEGNIKIGTANTDYFISKYNSQGKLIWVKQIKNTKGLAYIGTMEIDRDENVYFTGSFGDTLDFDPGPATQKIGSKGTQDGFITKLDSSGNWIWTKLIGNKNATAFVSTITIDNADNIITSVPFSGTLIINSFAKIDTFTSTNYNKILICKMNVNGNFIWSKSFSSNEKVNISAIKTDDAGNIYSCGEFKGTTDFNPSGGIDNLVCSQATYQDIFCSKLNASGNFVWVKQLAGKGNKYVNSVAVDKNENVYLTGAFSDSLDFDPGSGKIFLHNYARDSYICKLDKSGNYSWAYQIGGNPTFEDGINVIVNNNSDIYVTGLFTGFCDFDFQTGTKYLYAENEGTSMYYGKYSTNGELIWIKQVDMNVPPKEFSYGVFPNNIAFDDNGHVYIAGIFDFSADFNPGKDILNLTSQGGFDIFLLALKEASFASFSTTIPSQFELYPNPTLGMFRITNLNAKYIQLFNSQGQLIDNSQISIEFENNNTLVDISNLSNGIYILKAESSNSNHFFKIIKN
jgi:hypothetical protein